MHAFERFRQYRLQVGDRSIGIYIIDVQTCLLDVRRNERALELGGKKGWQHRANEQLRDVRDDEVRDRL